MSEIPGDLRYTETHEWIRELPDGRLEVGITAHAQEALGDLVYVELPEQGSEVTSGEGLAVVESVKAASDVYSPVDGEIDDINSDLADAPEAINQDPYEGGWLVRIKPTAPVSLEHFMDADHYQAFCEAEGS